MRKSSVCEGITYRETWDVQDTRMNDYNPCLDSSDVLGIDRFLFLCVKSQKKKEYLLGKKQPCLNNLSIIHLLVITSIYLPYSSFIKEFWNR